MAHVGGPPPQVATNQVSGTKHKHAPKAQTTPEAGASSNVSAGASVSSTATGAQVDQTRSDVHDAISGAADQGANAGRHIHEKIKQTGHDIADSKVGQGAKEFGKGVAHQTVETTKNVGHFFKGLFTGH